MGQKFGKGRTADHECKTPDCDIEERFLEAPEERQLQVMNDIYANSAAGGARDGVFALLFKS